MMNLQVQKRLAAQILKCSPKRIVFDEHSLEDIKEAITKRDIKSLIADKIIQSKPARGISKASTRKNKNQKRKGLQKGQGSRKGKPTARVSKKENWMNKIRVQRTFLKNLKEKQLIDNKTFTTIMARAKGGFFRNRKHLKGYLEENKLFKKQNGIKKKTSN